jgi:O-glycosyl hydrolase
MIDPPCKTGFSSHRAMAFLLLLAALGMIASATSATGERRRQLAIGQDSTSSPVVIVVDNSVEHQRIEGFGATTLSLVNSDLGDLLSPPLRARAIDAAYSQVGISMGNLEGALPETPDGWDQRRNDNDDPFDINWEGFQISSPDAMKEKVVDLAEPLGFNGYFLGQKINIRWTSPWLGEIRRTDYDRFLDEAAEQIVAAQIYWRDTYSIVPRYQMPFNEPAGGNQDSLSAGEQVGIIKRAGARLREEGFTSLKFVVPNEETVERSYASAQAILSDPEAREYVGAIGYHPYPYGSAYSSIPEILRTSGSGNPDLEEIARREQLRDLGQWYGIPVWMTEVSHGAVTPLSFDALRGRAIHIHDELVYTDAAAYFGMLNMWNTESQTQHFGNDDLLSPDNEGNIVFVDTYAERVYISGMGYAIGHYARWIKRGAIRLEATSGDPLLQVTAFRDDRRRRLVLVVINNSPEGQTIQVELRGLRLRRSLRGEQSTESAYWQPLGWQGLDGMNSFAVTIPGQSVTTLAGLIRPINRPPSRRR